MAVKKSVRQSERQALKRFLSRFAQSRQQNILLQQRLSSLQQQFPQNTRDASSADSLAHRIRAQSEKNRKNAAAVMDILEYLPPDSPERTVLELRCLDGQLWKEIQSVTRLSRASCFRYYNHGLDLLLAVGKVREIIGLTRRC